MDPKQAEIGGKDYLVFLYVYYNPLYPFALRPSHQGLVQGWNLEVLLAARTEGRWKCRQSYADSMCGHSTRSRALSSLSCKVSRGRRVLYLGYNVPAQILN